jgi:hypothetical protein
MFVRRASWENAHLNANVHRRAGPDWGFSERTQQHPAVTRYSLDQVQAQVYPIVLNEEDRHIKRRIGVATGVGRIVLWNDRTRRANLVLVERPSRPSIDIDERSNILYSGSGDKECAWPSRSVCGLGRLVVEPLQKTGDGPNI